MWESPNGRDGCFEETRNPFPGAPLERSKEVQPPFEEWQGAKRLPFFNGRPKRGSASKVSWLAGDGRHEGQACAAPGAVSDSGQRAEQKRVCAV